MATRIETEVLAGVKDFAWVVGRPQPAFAI